MSPDLRPSALVISPEAPFPLSGGGSMRSASLFHYLGEHYRLDVIAFREPGAPDPAAAFPEGLARQTSVIDLPYHSRAPLARAARNLLRYARGRVPLTDRFAGFGPRLSQFLRGRRYDLAIIEHFWCAPYQREIEQHAGRVVLDLHNVESVLLERMALTAAWPASMALNRFARLCREAERRWLPRFPLLLVTSPEDARFIERISPGAVTRVHPNTIPLVPQPDLPEEPLLVFSGNMEYPPNRSAVRYFRRRVWPLLRKRWPDLRWRLVGKNPRAVADCAAGDPRIEIAGPVEDAISALARARVVVAPLLAASGTRVKILEAWAAGRAVVSTTLGAEGLPARDGEHLLVADSPSAFAAAVSRLLASPDERRVLGRAGRNLFEQHFTWQQGWSNLAKIGL
jgi:glycosyltransferase involved in cell wall biosynthesis